MSESENIRSFGHGSTHTTIYFPEIRAFHIKLAPLLEQQEIVRKLDAMLPQIDSLAVSADNILTDIKKTRQALLSAAYEGQSTSSLHSIVAPASLGAENSNPDGRSAKIAKPENMDNAMVSKKSLSELLLEWPADGLTFSEIREAVASNYDNLQAAIFSLLTSVPPTLKQNFDPETKVLKLMRISSCD
jgi:type I restriction enzyme S subunit